MFLLSRRFVKKPKQTDGIKKLGKHLKRSLRENSMRDHFSLLSRKNTRNLIDIWVISRSNGWKRTYQISLYFLRSPHPLPLLLIFRTFSQFRSLRISFWKRLLCRLYELRNTCETFVVSLTRRFVSAKRPIEFIGKIVGHPAQSPVRKFLMSTVRPSISQKDSQPYLHELDLYKR